MASTRVRRVFVAASKLEAVRRNDEQRTLRVPVMMIARDLDVRQDMLRSWVRQAHARVGQAPADVFPGERQVPSAEAEVWQLRCQLEVSSQETAFLEQGCGELREGVAVSDNCAVIAAYRRDSPVTLMCHVPEVSRSGFHRRRELVTLNPGGLTSYLEQKRSAGQPSCHSPHWSRRAAWCITPIAGVSTVWTTSRVSGNMAASRA